MFVTIYAILYIILGNLLNNIAINGKKKKILKPRDVCICCIQELIHPKENTCFWKFYRKKGLKKIGQVFLLY